MRQPLPKHSSKSFAKTFKNLIFGPESWTKKLSIVYNISTVSHLRRLYNCSIKNDLLKNVYKQIDFYHRKLQLRTEKNTFNKA